jgi:hypothetical protein
LVIVPAFLNILRTLKLASPGGGAMRSGVGVMVLAAGLIVSLQAFGQSWTGANPRNLQFKPIDTSKAMKAFPTNKAFHTPSPVKNTGIDRFFPKLTLGSWPPRQGIVTIADGKNNPFQPNPPKGVNWFNMTGKKK